MEIIALLVEALQIIVGVLGFLIGGKKIISDLRKSKNAKSDEAKKETEDKKD